MTGNSGYGWSKFLKRKKILWPNPEDSIGIFYRSMHKNSCWEAIGPARETFVRIAEEIKSHLEKCSAPVSPPVTWSIYMIGRARECASPTIMFCCKEAGPRKEVRKIVEESYILDKYPGILTGDSSLPPDYDQLVPLAGLDMMDYDGTGTVSATKEIPDYDQLVPLAGLDAMDYDGTGTVSATKEILAEPSRDVFGLPIYIRDFECKDALMRKATGGGILRSGNRYFILTVAHAFTTEVLAEDVESDEKVDFEFDIDEESDSGGEDFEMAERTSRGSLTPIESPESDLTVMSVSDIEDVRSELQDSSYLSALGDSTFEEIAANTPDSISHINTDQIGSGTATDKFVVGKGPIISSIDGSYPGLDYALIEIVHPLLHTFNQIQLNGGSSQSTIYPEQVVSARPDSSRNILAVTGSGGLLRGRISETPTFMKVPHSNSIQELWTVRLFGNLAKGDCGSWVLDEKTGDVYGHIIAGSPASGAAFIVPAYQVHADLRSRFSGKIKLCSKTDSMLNLGQSEDEPWKQRGRADYRDLHTTDSQAVGAFSAAMLQANNRAVKKQPYPWRPELQQALAQELAMDRRRAPTMIQQHQERLQTRSADRGGGNRGSSCSSLSSTRSGSNSELGYPPSPITPASPGSDYLFSHRRRRTSSSAVSGSSFQPLRSSIFVKDEKLEESSLDLPLLNIEKEGDTKISWIMYYEFVVTKTEAFYKLQPGYIPTEKFPARIEMEKSKGDKKHHCGVPNCRANPFTRHYDLERHFRTVHKYAAVDNTFFCDYPKCDHKDPLRKDHCREHYREYHIEDLIKRGERNIDEFLSSRVDYVKQQWWRCGRCLHRVKTDPDGWQCPDCKASCEPERQAWRQKAFAAEAFAADDNIAPADNNSAPDSYIIGCGMCENAWLPALNDPTGRLWLSCPTCQPGPQETVQF